MASTSDTSNTSDTPPPTPGPGKKNYPPNPQQTTITVDECFTNFKKYITNERPGLSAFYDDLALREVAKKAKDMAEKLLVKKCGKEIAMQLSLLTLYDIALLLDDSVSMGIEENGERKLTMKDTMKAITEVYDLANDFGLLSVRFFNSDQSFIKVKSKNVYSVWKKCLYGGVTRIGSALSERVLDKYVWAPAGMKKPLLVMTITDGAVEGERSGLLRDVIANCVKRLEDHSHLNANAVSFHFSSVGNDPDAMDFLQKLDNHTTVGKYVDCLDINIKRNDLKEEKWSILPKLLLGALTREWDDRDEEVDVERINESSITKPEVQDEEADEEDDPDDV
ncbi:hypothetical protein Q9L58_005864 [Maublancomyces gigas]|uniref:VWFA domain-containing protein n=1 Tax=Discina gigas TaxID=1032678 RepID=A0ABR3GGY6_9PEZI